MARTATSRNFLGFGKRKPARKKKAAAKSKRSAFGWLTEKKETYRRDVKGERAELIRQAKAEQSARSRSERERSRELLAELKDDAWSAGQSAKQRGQKVTPYMISLNVSPRWEEAFGKRRARELVEASIKAGYRQNPASNPAHFNQLGWEAGRKRHQELGAAVSSKEIDGQFNIWWELERPHYMGGAQMKKPIEKAAYRAGWKSALRNPCARTKKVNVTDRAKRYRANQPGCRPAGAKKCKLCGSKDDVMVDHADGNESNGRKANLRWLCRSCNNTLGAEMARLGQGRRTVQYNPKSKGAQNLFEYMQAVLQHQRGEHDAGGKIIHDTPKAKRREYASAIWATRRAHGTDIDTSRPLRHMKPSRSDEPDWVTNPSKRNCEGLSTEYRLGYNLGQMDRQTAALPKTWAELEATFNANFPAGTRASALPFFEAYKAGYDLGEPARAGVSNPGNGRLHGGRGLSKKANPEPVGDDSEEFKQAKRIAELFHGRVVKAEIEVTENIHTHDWYAELGPLVELRIKAPKGFPYRKATFKFSLKGDALVRFWTSPDGRQFYAVGGDQELNLEALGMEKGTDWFRHFMTIGEVTYFVYRDAKKFHRFKLTDYDHKVGSGLDWTGTRHVQNTNVKPTMIYDTLSKKISFSGGLGKIETENLVDGMSPGIVN